MEFIASFMNIKSDLVCNTSPMLLANRDYIEIYIDESENLENRTNALRQKQMTQNIVIGLVGEKGSGKGTFAAHISEIQPEKRIISLRFSDLLRETLDLWHIPSTRMNLQKIVVIMEETFGTGLLSNAIYERISKLDADIVIVDGVRWKTDVSLIRRFKNNFLVYVTASPQIRYRRTVARAEKDGESDASFEQFEREEQAKNELLIPKIGADADYTIKNEGTVEEFRVAIKSFAAAIF
jgi:uridine kinase